MNNPEQNLVRVTIYGHEYTVRAVADPNYIAEVAAYVDERMRDTELNLEGPQSPTRISILAAMSITDELFTERRQITLRQAAMRENLIRKCRRYTDAQTVALRPRCPRCAR